MPATVVTRAPTRIDLGGGWTDVPPYCDREGGFVCNIAINRYATVTLGERLSDPHGRSDRLVQAVLRRSGIDERTVVLESDFPVGAGLGGSSSVSAALIVAAAECRGRAWNRRDVAEEGRRIEVEDLGIAGGRQDHYAATFGGALALTFGSGASVDVRPLAIDARRAADFVSRCVLVYTGQSRISGDTITAVIGAYEAGETRVVTALARMRDIARQIAAALEPGDFDAVGRLLAEHWRYQRDLHPSIPTPLIDEIASRAASAGALGAKPMGASGGGCVLAVAPASAVDRVRAALAPLGSIIDFGPDMDGVTVVGTDTQ